MLLKRWVLLLAQCAALASQFLTRMDPRPWPGPRLTSSRQHELVENRPQPLHPPVHAEGLKDLRAVPNPLPVIDAASQSDLRDSSNAHRYGVAEVGEALKSGGSAT